MAISIQKAVRIPSLIATIVKSLGRVCSDDEGRSDVPKEFKPDEKITYNRVIKYRDIIKNFATFYNVCEEYLNAYDDSNIRGKAKILNCVHLWYLDVKGDLLLENKDSGKSDIEIIQENSDRLITNVRDKIYETVEKSQIVDEIYIEDMQYSIQLGMHTPKFVIHDKMENTHINQIKTIFEICETIEAQYIIPILRERIDKVEQKFIEKAKVLELSTTDKFFGI